MITETQAPVVTIAPGRVRGFWRGEPGTAGASAAFLGIPFAQAPVGALRFAAPVPPEPWDGTRDALEYGATAQRGDKGITLIPEPSVPGESTLNVNVFTPAPGSTDDLDTGAARPLDPAAALLPVLVYIHGGGYTAGSPASPWYDGRAFNRDAVVTVSVSYRLGFDGFGHIQGAPSNRGVRDWIAALEWVRDNITAFGGDPTRVTIAGQSAGGGAVLTLLGMPAAQHLFHAVWALSGALGDIAPERAWALSARLAKLAGVAPTREGFASVPEERLLELQEKASAPEGGNPMAGVRVFLDEGLPWGPAIDGDLIPRPTLASLRRGVGADKPLVLGATDDEFTMITDGQKGKLRFVPVSLALGQLGLGRAGRKAYLAANEESRSKGTAAILGRYMTDKLFRTAVVRIADIRHAERADSQTWVYRFTWSSPKMGWAVHCLDVPFWFDCLEADGVREIAGDAPPAELAAAVHGAATAFVRDGDPGWTSWATDLAPGRVFDGDPTTPAVMPNAFASVLALM